jgi:hypothetical protein
MRRETKSQGSGRRKPLRRCETLRAEGTGEVNRCGAIAQAERRRKDEEPQGRCHQLSGCVSCTRPVPKMLASRGRTPHRRRLGVAGAMVGGKLSDPQAGSRGASAHRRNCSKTERLSVRRSLRWLPKAEKRTYFFPREEASEVVVIPLSLPTSVGYPTRASVLRGVGSGKHGGELGTNRSGLGSIDESTRISFGRFANECATRHHRAKRLRPAQT